MILIQCKYWSKSKAFPRIRGGDPNPYDVDDTIAILFPAYAGVILQTSPTILRFGPFPRIRGGDPVYCRERFILSYFSPHTRG